jgi:hypothetical protein
MGLLELRADAAQRGGGKCALARGLDPLGTSLAKGVASAAHAREGVIDGGELGAIVLIETFEHAGQRLFLTFLDQLNRDVSLQGIEIAFHPPHLAEELLAALEQQPLHRDGMLSTTHYAGHGITSALPGYLAWTVSR